MTGLRVFTLFTLFLLFQISKGDDVLPIINGLIKANLDKINTAIKQNVPDSYGNCNDNNPPSPCGCSNGCTNIYEVHKPWEYKAYARWITGLRSGHLTSIIFSANKSISVEIKGVFDQLPLSLWIGECFTFDQCSILWDNTDGCCGQNKNFLVDISVDCKNDYPFFSNIRLTNLNLDQFEITEKIIGIKINLEDITGAVSNVVSNLLTDYLSKESFIPYNNTKITLLEFANIEIKELTTNFTCPTMFEVVDGFLEKVFQEDKVEGKVEDTTWNHKPGDNDDHRHYGDHGDHRHYGDHDDHRYYGDHDDHRYYGDHGDHRKYGDHGDHGKHKYGHHRDHGNDKENPIYQPFIE